MQKISGIGGFVFKAKNPRALNKWYAAHLGVVIAAEDEDTERQHGDATPSVVVASAGVDSTAQSPFMVNFQVDNLDGVLNQLRSDDIKAVKDIATYPYGRFAWVYDPEGNKVELWEPLPKR